MASQEDKQGAPAPGSESSPTPVDDPKTAGTPGGENPPAPTPAVEDSCDYEDPYASPVAVEETKETEAQPPASTGGTGGAPPPPPPPGDGDGGGDDEDGMLRMSFLEHLEELRARILRSLYGIGAAFLFSLIFCNDLWLIVSEPATDALTQLGVKDPRLAQITPMEVFTTVWVKLPMLTSIFLASPWILFQVWRFIAPGLYKKERRWAGPFVVCSAGLFILGGLFAYFVAFRFGLVFLLGIGRDIRIQPIVSVTEYFDLFVNVTLGIGVVFELPVLIFFLTLLRIVSPAFLMRHIRYAILGIVIIAAIVTPTPDVFNLMMFAVPMILLFFVGIFASYLLVLNRENRRFPWKIFFYIVAAVAAVAGGILYLLMAKYGYHFLTHWPFLKR